MFSLIITIISIALVAALALATLYYGGSAFNQGSAKARAAKLFLQGQQLTGAAELYKANTGDWPQNLNALLAGKYLTSVPVAKAGVQEPAGAMGTAQAAAETTWLMPVDYTPLFRLNPVDSVDVCAHVNQLGSLKKNAILKKAYPALSTQCYGGDGTPFTMVVKTSTAQTSLVGGVPAGEIASGPIPTDPASADWSQAPKGEGNTPPPPGGGEGPQLVNVPSAPSCAGNVCLSYTRFVFKDAPLSNWLQADPSPVMTNNSADAVEVLSFGLTGGDSGFYADPGYCYGSLQPGASCPLSLYINPASTALQQATALVVLSNGASLEVQASGRGIEPPQPPGSVRTGGLQFSLANLDVGEVALGDSTVPSWGSGLELLNVSQAPISLTSLEFSSPEYYDIGGCPPTLAPGEQCRVGPAFAPTVLGARPATLTVNFSTGSQVITLTGTGRNAPPQSSLSSTYIDLTEVSTGDTLGELSTASVLFTNTDTRAIAAPELAWGRDWVFPLAGPQNEQHEAPVGTFSATHDCPTMVAPGTSCTITLTYVSAVPESGDVFLYVGTEGTWLKQIVIIYGRGPDWNSQMVVPGFTQSVYADTDIGSVPAGIESQVAATFTNVSAYPLTLHTDSPSLTNRSENATLLYTHDCPAVLAAGESCNYTMNFTPLAPGAFKVIPGLTLNGKPDFFRMVGTAY